MARSDALSQREVSSRDRQVGVEGASSDVTTERILDVADRLFAQRGFAATTVRDVVAGAGYTTTAVYARFGRKAGLFITALERAQLRHKLLWREVLDGVSPAAAGAAMGTAMTIQMKESAWFAA